MNKIQELLIEKGIEEVERKAFIQQLQAELKGKKYGLVWENKVEKVSEQLKTHIPYLIEMEEKRLIGSPEDEIHHLLIEGDNLEALTLLQTTHKNEIDVCYIDPPYNRGKNDFVYNDKFIDKEDVYRHSKWLSFIEKRLRLVYDLLTEKGIIVISIDDNEMCRLKLLCDEIFGEDNFIVCAPTIMNLKGNQDEFGFAGTHEYTLVYAKNKIAVELNQFEINEDEIEDKWEVDEIGYYKKGATLKRTGVDAPVSRRPNSFFPILCDTDGSISTITEEEHLKIYNPKTKELNIDYAYELKDAYENMGYTVVLPITNGENTSWRWGRKTVEKESDEIIVVKGRDEISLYKKQRPQLGDLPTKKPKSVLYKPDYSSGNGTKQLKEIFEQKKIFENPKPLQLIKDLIYITGKKDAVILDFFAGSGTTGHAVLELNKEDHGKRRCILCTNNEVSKDKQLQYFCMNDEEFEEYSKTEFYRERIKEPEFQSLGICQAVTYRRIQNVVNGWYCGNKRRVEGISSNWNYYKINTIPKVNNSTDNAVEYLTKGIEMIAIKENTFNRENFKDYCILSNKDKVILVYLEPFVLGHEVIEISNKLKDYKQSQKIIYSTMTDVSISGIEVKEYPQEILEQIERIQQILKQWEGELDEE